MAETSLRNLSGRLVSLDAYRGFIMLAMASSGFRFARVADQAAVVERFSGTWFDGPWRWAWESLAYQFGHVAWTGCSFWDLIQPSFIFMVGVAMPFSFARRLSEGQPAWRRIGHAAWRAAVLVLLGVFLASNRSEQTNFVFTNVLAQIGLGYLVVYLLLGRSRVIQVLALAAVLGGTWYSFAAYSIPPARRAVIEAYLVEHQVTGDLDRIPAGLHPAGLAGHWDKHTNLGASVDRALLNQLPGGESAWRGERYWVNRGGYQTLNFLPSIATMLLGLFAGQWLQPGGSARLKLRRLLIAGGSCLAVGMAVDTTIWPVDVSGSSWAWSLCPAVKRLWTPTWAVYSSGWTFLMLAAFYWVIDVRGWQRWSFPLVVVGVNSIAMYLMAQLIKGWTQSTLTTHLNTVGGDLGTTLFEGLYGPIISSVTVLFALWLICLWLYRRRIFVRI